MVIKANIQKSRRPTFTSQPSIINLNLNYDNKFYAAKIIYKSTIKKISVQNLLIFYNI